MNLGDEEKLDEGNLPVKSRLYAHYLYLRKKKIEAGEWKCNVSLSDAAKAVKLDVQAQWEKTSIPHTLEGLDGDRKVERVIKKCQDLAKIREGGRIMERK